MAGTEQEMNTRFQLLQKIHTLINSETIMEVELSEDELEEEINSGVAENQGDPFPPAFPHYNNSSRPEEVPVKK